MKKDTRRAASMAAAAQRRAARIRAGGKSKYAKKRARSVRGNYSPTSPFYLPPEVRNAIAAGTMRQSESDGLDELVAAGLCSPELRRAFRERDAMARGVRIEEREAA